MACYMEHICQSCGHEWFDNQYRSNCPRCKSGHVISHYDEELQRGDE